MTAGRQPHSSEDDKLRASKVLPLMTSPGFEATAHSEAVKGITANNTFHLLSGFVECANSIVFSTANHVPFDSQQSGAARDCKVHLSVSLGVRSERRRRRASKNGKKFEEATHTVDPTQGLRTVRKSRKTRSFSPRSLLRLRFTRRPEVIVLVSPTVTSGTLHSCTCGEHREQRQPTVMTSMHNI